MLLEDYILQHIEPESDYMHRLWRATNIHLERGRMASGHLQGRLLKMLVEMIKPGYILEIGTFSGYSALCMAEGLKDNDEMTDEARGARPKIVTFDINDETEDFTRGWIEQSTLARYIDYRIGDALTEAPKTGVIFDMAFIDGDKRHYVDYYRMVMSITRPGAFIIADNTLWDGHVLDTAYRDAMALGVEAFNDLVARDNRVEKVILPIRDGLTLIRKKKF